MTRTDLIAKFFKNTKTFDAVTQKVKFLTAENGSCTASLMVEEQHTNPMGGLHGGFSATLIDIISSAALLTHQHGEKPSVSVNMNLTYVSGAKVGEEIVISSNTLRVGKRMAFLEAEIRKKEGNALLVRGEHTKYLL